MALLTFWQFSRFSSSSHRHADPMSNACLQCEGPKRGDLPSFAEVLKKRGPGLEVHIKRRFYNSLHKVAGGDEPPPPETQAGRSKYPSMMDYPKGPIAQLESIYPKP